MNPLGPAAKTGVGARLNGQLGRDLGSARDKDDLVADAHFKGHLVNETAEIGDEVTIITRVGRQEHGTLIEVNPFYQLDYGEYVPEITAIEDQLRAALFGGNEK